jgi:hypothetical protein
VEEVRALRGLGEPWRCGERGSRRLRLAQFLDEKADAGQARV